MKRGFSCSEKTIILASKSPRRREILEKLNLPFLVHPADISENINAEDPEKAVMSLAAEKVIDVGRSIYGTGKPAVWILGADTIVIKEGRILGKPSDRDEAEKFLKNLSGGSHRVLTGLALLNTVSNQIYKGFESTTVFFAELPGDVVSWYVSTGEWKGAAGGYRIQERGECLVDRIEGSYSNVVGLPIRLFFCILLDAGYPAIQ